VAGEHIGRSVAGVRTVRPATRYARIGDLHIAYEVLGEGPRDLVYVPEFRNSMEVQWEQPDFERFLLRLASFTRLIMFDNRGTGISDPVPLDHLPSLELYMDDIRAVMDSAGQSVRRSSLPAAAGVGTMSSRRR
jgi:pimeloyl-ACP methyl ester carboxylesterase